MRQHAWATLAVIIALTLSSTVWADDDNDADPAQRHEALFDQLDTNEDGSITKDEVPEDQQRLLKRLFNNGDTDADGRLSRQEFLAALKEKRAKRPLLEKPAVDYAPGDNRPDPRMIFQKLDANGDGVVRVDELPEKLQKFFSEVIERADEDGDQALGPREFFQAIRAISERRPELLRKFEFAGLNADRPRHGGLMRALDGDGNGELSSDEIDKAPEVLRALDADNDGLVSRRELDAPQALAMADRRDRPTAEKILKKIMQADSDGDERISRDEAPERLQQRFDRVDTDGDGFLDRDEITAGVQARAKKDRQKRPGNGKKKKDRPGTGKGDTKRPNPEQIIKHIMRADKDGDERVSREEAPERLQQRFDRIDTNSDGFLDRDEITSGVQAMSGKDHKKGPKGGKRGAKRPNPEQILKHIMRADKDGDDRISREEAPERLQQRFDRIDANRDGFLDRDEITAAAKAMVEKAGQNKPKKGRRGRPKGGKKKKPNQRDFN